MEKCRDHDRDQPGLSELWWPDTAEQPAFWKGPPGALKASGITSRARRGCQELRKHSGPWIDTETWGTVGYSRAGGTGRYSSTGRCRGVQVEVREGEGAMGTLLQVKDLRTHFFTLEGVIRAVDGVSYDVRQGETVAIVGESGCGKSVSALSIMRLIPYPPGRIVAGEIWFNGKNLLALSDEEMRQVRGKEIAMIFQEPMTSLNPTLPLAGPPPSPGAPCASTHTSSAAACANGS